MHQTISDTKSLFKNKHRILWVDLIAGTRTSEVPAELGQKFEVGVVRSVEYVNHEVSKANPLCVFYDCDYADRKRLMLIRSVKEAFPSVAFVLLTLQHSESLAIWAFRQGALDYLVKPVRADELAHCTQRLLKIAEYKSPSSRRATRSSTASIPETVLHMDRQVRDRVAPAVYYVQVHYKEQIYMDAVARHCGISPTYFSKAFHRRYRMPFQEFLLRFRIAKARRALRASKAGITDVAYSVGFRDPSYFTRMFKRYVGVSPSEFCRESVTAPGDDPTMAEIEGPSISCSQVVRALAADFPPRVLALPGGG